MAASMFRCACNRGKSLICSNLKETYSRQKRCIIFRKGDEQYVPKTVPYQTYPKESLEEKYPEVEISVEDYKHVERLFPLKMVPLPPEHESYPTPSGWLPPDKALLETEQSCYVKRTRNCMLPVYVHIDQKSQQVTTKVRSVIGDIWALDQDIKKHLKEKTGKDIDSQVHEVGAFLRYRGDHADTIAAYLLERGF